MSGVGALRGAPAYETGFLDPGQCEVQEAVGAVAFGEALAEAGPGRATRRAPAARLGRHRLSR